MNKKLCIALIVLAVILGGVLPGGGTALAWQADGWVYFNWPFAYSDAEGTWYYFSTDGTQWIYNYSTTTWMELGDPAGLSSDGWVYVTGTRGYSINDSTWYYLEPNGTLWVADMSDDSWSYFGALAMAPGRYFFFSSSNGINYTYGGVLVIDESGTFNGGTWEQFGNNVTLTSDIGTEAPGSFIECTGDGTFAIVGTFVGAPGDYIAASTEGYDEGSLLDALVAMMSCR